MKHATSDLFKIFYRVSKASLRFHEKCVRGKLRRFGREYRGESKKHQLLDYYKMQKTQSLRNVAGFWTMLKKCLWCEICAALCWLHFLKWKLLTVFRSVYNIKLLKLRISYMNDCYIPQFAMCAIILWLVSKSAILMQCDVTCSIIYIIARLSENTEKYWH